MATDTQSVLDSMTAAIINRKRGVAAASGLTPVGFEAPRVSPPPVTSLAGRHETVFPYDDPQTVHTAISHGLKLVEEVKAELEHVTKGLLALGALYSAPEPLPPPEDPVRVAEREADARFAADLAAKQAAAQAQVFSAVWTCPTHGIAATVEQTSRKGRKYRACTKCSEFEREVTA